MKAKSNFFSQLALNLAEVNLGKTKTNPSVGCVIVQNGSVISSGITSVSGRPHAESNAIKNSIENLSGSKMYVTLEPCCHHGVTPPCTDLIVKSKISEVIYSVTDIDFRVRNKSFKILSSKKIKVRKGLLGEKVKNFYSTYYYNRKKKLPYVTGKIAVSKNNLIYSKLDKKITNTKADKFTHLLRYKNDSLMISYKTLNNDNPKLNCRLYGLNKYSPKRIILDSKLNTNINSFIIKTANKSNTIIFYNKAGNSQILSFKKKGINLIRSKIDNKGRFDIKVILKKLYKLNCRNLLVEGGDELTNYLLRNKIFNTFYLYKSDKNLSKKNEYLNFNSLNLLKQKYKKKIDLKLDLGKNKITLYKI